MSLEKGLENPNCLARICEVGGVLDLMLRRGHCLELGKTREGAHGGGMGSDHGM